MNNKLTKIALTRLGLVVVVKREVVKGQPGVVVGGALNASLMQIGYYIDNWQEVGSLTKEHFNNIVDVLLKEKGGDVKYVPLFANFPDEVPNDFQYLLNRIIALYGYEVEQFKKGSYGADPVTQLQDEELYEAVVKEQKEKGVDRVGVWKKLEAVSYEEAVARLIDWVNALLMSKTPVQESLWEDCYEVLEVYTEQQNKELKEVLSKVTVKETLVRLAYREWLKDGTTGLLTTATDLLRLLALSMGQDITLTQPIKLKGMKLSKGKRRAIMELLNKDKNLEEQLQQYRGLWLSIASFLHPGDFAKKNRFNKVVEAFDALRNKRLKTFESKVNNALTTKDKLDLLVKRPSLLIRKLSMYGDEAAPYILTIDPAEVSLPLLLQAKSALAYKDVRTVVNKIGKTYNVESSKSPKSNELDRELEKLIVKKLEGTYEELRGRKVWLDKALTKTIIPLHERKKSSGLLSPARGTRIPLDKQYSTLRVFLYWHQRDELTDLDLSLLKVNSEFKVSGHLSWNNYGSDETLKHSGDVVNAPYGATEFIDINLTSAVFENCYGAVTILKYGGEDFNSLLTCHSGWMLRKDCSSTEVLFDPKTVANKVDVKSNAKNWIPFIIDFEHRELIYVDVYTEGKRTIESIKHLPKLIEGLTKYCQYRPTYWQLIDYYLKSNAAVLTTDRSDADITIGIDDSCDINVNSLVGVQTLTIFDLLKTDIVNKVEHI